MSTSDRRRGARPNQMQDIPRPDLGPLPLPEVLDSHTHLWKRTIIPQPWIDLETMSAIDRDFWVGDLQHLQERRGIRGSLVVQSANSLVETSELLAAADGSVIRGVIGWVDLEDNVSAQLESLRRGRGGHLLVGIRHLVHQDPDPHWLCRDTVATGLDQLSAAGLPFDLVVRADQLADTVQVASSHPHVTFVLDHLGRPPITSNELGRWAKSLESLANLPNVVAKVSGLTVEAAPGRWSTEDLRPIVELALKLFGTGRLMFGSDWPVVELAGGIDNWIAVVRALVPDPDHALFFAGNAVSTYGLGRGDA